MVRALLPVVVLVAVLVPQAAASDEAWAPTAVVALRLSETETRLSWAPGTEVADYYLVWGVAGQTHDLLANVSLEQIADGALVVAGYASYAVSGVLAGAESERVSAVGAGSGGEEPCIIINPNGGIVIRCLPKPVVVQKRVVYDDGLLGKVLA